MALPTFVFWIPKNSRAGFLMKCSEPRGTLVQMQNSWATLGPAGSQSLGAHPGICAGTRAAKKLQIFLSAGGAISISLPIVWFTGLVPNSHC